MSSVNTIASQEPVRNIELSLREYKFIANDIHDERQYIKRLKFFAIILSASTWIIQILGSSDNEETTLYISIPQIIFIFFVAIENQKSFRSLTYLHKALGVVKEGFIANNDIIERISKLERRRLKGSGLNLYYILLALSVLVPLGIYYKFYMNQAVDESTQNASEDGDASSIRRPIPLQPRYRSGPARSSNGLYYGGEPADEARKERIRSLIDRKLELVPDSTILFNPPDSMIQGKKERIEARISLKDIGAALSKDLKGRGSISTEKIEAGPIMRVSLTADKEDFDMTKYSNDQQIVAGKDYAQWEWDVKPLKAGTIDLHLKATIPIRNSDIGEELYDLKVMDKAIKVEVNAWYTSREFVKVNWKEIMASIVLPLIVWGFKRYTDIKDRKQEQDE